MDDPRFKHVATDPRFKTIPKRTRKVKIDSRFKHMFSDGGFKVKYDVDKRGRKVNQTSNEDLRKYYELDEDNEPAVDDPPGSDNAHHSDNGTGDDSTDDEGVLEYSENEVVHDWGETGRGDVPVGDDTSRRLALCNMDWDRINAHDVYVLATSFKPSGSTIASVAIYPSDFGQERLAKEDVLGPTDILEPEEGLDEEGPAYSQERLREYQLNRFKYYYAVIECDGVQTAEHIYQQCDGLEYEHSGGQLDLRFIPDDLTFDDREAKSVATETTLPANFNPSTFVSPALQQSKVHMTWDETDPHRLQTTMRKFVKEDTAGMDFNAYLASSSDSEGEDRGKYKELLGDALGSKGQSEAEEDMEITWEPGLKDTAEKLVKKKLASNDGLTPWEKYLNEKKRKKKEKKLEKNDEEPGNSDDLGFDDQFFQHDVTVATAKSSKRGRNKLSKEETAERDKERSELELLVMEERDYDKQHFSLKDIIQRESEAGKKRKRKRKTKEEQPIDDTFVVDVQDTRFDALYESHVYAPDPSHPQYKKTKAMEALMNEKMRRRIDKKKRAKDESVKSKETFADASLDSLVKSVKQKTTTFNQQKRKNKKSKLNL